MPLSLPRRTARPVSLERRLAQLTLVAWLVLVATGLLLTFRYRPTATATYQDMETLRDGIHVELWSRRLHRVATVPALVLPLIMAIRHLAQSRIRAAAPPIAALVATGGLWYSGRLLPWDQLALWSVTVGTRMQGYGSVFFDENVRFALVNGDEVSPSTLRFWFFIHSLALPAALVLIAIAYVYLSPRRTSSDSADPQSAAPTDERAALR